MSQPEPSYATPPPPDGPAEPDETLEQQLKRLQDELKGAQEAQTQASFDVTDLQGRIAALTTLQKDIAKSTGDYEAARAALVEREQALSTYHDYETKCLTDIVGAAEAAIVEAVTDAETTRNEATNAVFVAKEKLTTLEGQLAAADEARQQASTAATELKNLAATIKARLSALDTIKAEVNAAKKGNDYALAYWLLVMGDFRSILDREPGLMAPDMLPDALLDAVNTLSNAEKAYAAKALQVSQQQAVLVEAETSAKAITKKYDEQLRTALKAITPADQTAPAEPSDPAKS